MKIKNLIFIVLIMAAALAFGYWLLFVRNPLPSDESIIEHFNKHKADFEEVVRRYREYPRPPNTDTSMWFEDGDTLEVYDRAGIARVSTIDYSPWLPQPYSPKTAEQLKESLASGTYRTLKHKYAALSISLSPKDKYYAITLNHSMIWKNIVFIPEPPRIKNNYLYWPVNSAGRFSTKDRVLDSLNNYPEDWSDFECVYKRIDVNWFISMCNGS